jgi:uncharacterized protein with HEPN domain
LEIIGEATKNLPKDFKEKHSNIEWRKIAGLRDVIVHGYFHLSLSLVGKKLKTFNINMLSFIMDICFF